MNANVNLSRRSFVRGTLVLGGAAAGGWLLAAAARAEEATAPTGSSDADGQAASVSPDASAASDASGRARTRNLVVYFTCPEPTGVDTVAGASRVVRDDRVYGNNELVATLIAAQTGADVFAIETVQTYPADHQELIAFGVAEQEASTLPELAEHLANIDDYDTIFLVHPIWNAQYPMPVRSFLAEVDLAGKTVYPVTCHGGSGFASTLAQLAEAEPEALISENTFSVSRDVVGEVDEDLAAWLEGLGYSREGASAGAATAERTLIAYFSHTGNTRALAERIQAATGCDLFEIVPEVAYPEGMSGAASVAEAEHDEGARPAVAAQVANWGDYDTVLLGYPVWYGTLPMVVATFLESYDWAGKTVAPFATSTGSDLADGLALIAACAPAATLADGYLAGEDGGTDEEITAWLAALGLGTAV